MTATPVDVAGLTPSVVGPRTRVATLDGLRALAFLSVFLNHGVALRVAWIGVDLFFVLSGFLITGILLRAKGNTAREFFGHFYNRRARRILPPYLVVLAAVAISGAWVRWSDVWWYFFTFTQNWAAAFQLGVGSLFPFWSLAVEEQFYIVWPVLCFVLSRRQLIVVSAVLVCVAPVLRAIATPFTPFHTVIFCLTPFRMDLLAAGALLALVWENHEAAIRARRPLVWFVNVAAGVAFFVPAALFVAWRASSNSEIFNTLGYSLSVVLCTSVIVQALISRPETAVARFLSAPLLTWLGRISYTCYLIHAPVLYFTRFAFGRFVGAAIGLVIIVALAEISWRLIEAPILQARVRPLPSYAL